MSAYEGQGIRGSTINELKAQIAVLQTQLTAAKRDAECLRTLEGLCIDNDIRILERGRDCGETPRKWIVREEFNTIRGEGPDLQTAIEAARGGE